ncbi:hypothetical protein MBANPS3_009438 [Mucor bainieri]
MANNFQLQFITRKIEARLRFRCHICTNSVYFANDAEQLRGHYVHHEISIMRQPGDYDVREHLPADISPIVRCRPCYGCPFCYACFSVEHFTNNELIQQHLADHINAAPLTAEQWQQQEATVLAQRRERVEREFEHQQQHERRRHQLIADQNRRNQEAQLDQETFHDPSQEVRRIWLTRARNPRFRRELGRRGGGRGRLGFGP